jgi:hypothetical protein
MVQCFTALAAAGTLAAALLLQVCDGWRAGGKPPEEILASKHSVKKYFWMHPSDAKLPPLHATVSYMKRMVQNLTSPRPWKPRNMKHSG